MTTFETQMNYVADHILSNGPQSKHDLISAVRDSHHAEWLILPSSPDGIDQFHAIAEYETAFFEGRGPRLEWYVDVESRPGDPAHRADRYALGGWDIVSVRDTSE